MDPIRNPYAPGAGQRPPELAGRDEQLAAVRRRARAGGRGRPERSLVLTGLRGVGKTVLLNALRGQAVRKGWGTGKLEARPDQSLRRPLASALHQAVRELGAPDPDRVDHVLGVIRSFAERAGRAGRQAARPLEPRHRRHRAVRGRADSGDVEIDLVELFNDVGGLAGRPRQGRRGLRRRDAGRRPRRRLARCARACHEISQSGAAA